MTPAVIPEIIQRPADPPRISFQNATAVRVGFLAAALVMLLISVPMPKVLMYAWSFTLLLAGGFFSVWLYARRTGQTLTVGSGARMGWITGVFCFTIVFVLFAFTLLAFSSEGGLTEFFREVSKAQGKPEMMEQLDSVLQNPAVVGIMMLVAVAMMFFTITLTSAVGGALGAKVLEKE